MATKNTIQALINTNLADGSDILASEHREVEDVLLKEIYPTVLSDDEDSTNVVTKINTNYEYDIDFSKQGRNIAFSGKVINRSGSLLSNLDFATITNTDFVSSPNIEVIGVSADGDFVSITFVANKIRHRGLLIPDIAYNFNGTYFAQN